MIYATDSTCTIKKTFTFIEKPGPPENLLPTDLTSESVRLEWNPPKYDGGLPLTSYIIEYRESSEETWTKVGQVKPTVRTYTVQNLREQQEYLFRVFAENPEGLSSPATSDVVQTIAEEKAEPFLVSYTVHTLQPRDEYFFTLTYASDEIEED